MAHNIAHAQNTDESLRLIAAQRGFYARAKRLAAGQASVSLLTPVVVAIAVGFNQGFRPWGAFLGLLVALVEMTLVEPAVQVSRSRGAALQEQFDCSVFALPWNTCVADRPPDPEDWSSFDVSDSTLRDWYPAATARLPIDLARAMCQRTNCWWDGGQRRTYATILLIASTVLVVGGVIFGLAHDMRMVDFVVGVMAPLYPAAVWLLREVRRQFEAAAKADHLKTVAAALWNDLIAKRLSGQESLRRSRQLQDAIYSHRRTAPFVYGWLYWNIRPKYEEQMQGAADQMAVQARAAGLSSDNG